jgi:hypothetical protein
MMNAAFHEHYVQILNVIPLQKLQEVLMVLTINQILMAPMRLGCPCCVPEQLAIQIPTKLIVVMLVLHVLQIYAPRRLSSYSTILRCATGQFVQRRRIRTHVVP